MTHPALLLALMTIAAPAHADWVEFGAAAQCASDESSFHVVPVITTSITAHDIQAPSGFYAFPLGRDQAHSCNLGRSNIELKLSVSPPQERGMGQGGGTVIISSLVVDGVAVISPPTNFNWQVVPGEPVLTKISLTRQLAGLTSTLCYSRGWNWEQPYAGEHCETTQVGR